MEIITDQGIKLITFAKFSALEGWDIRDRFIAFASSADRIARREYVRRVLGHACVMIVQQEIPLSTDALIDNHLCTPDNVGRAFIGTLAFSGIFATECLEQSDLVTAAGNGVATSFVAACMGALIQFCDLVDLEQISV